MFLPLILDITLEMRHEQSRHEFLSLDFCLRVIMKIFPYVFFQVFLPSHLDPLFTWNWPLLDWFYSIFMGISEKATATHSSTLAWKIPWTEEPGEVPSMGSHRVGHDWSDLAAAAVAVSSFPYYYCIAVYFPFSPVNICFKNFGGLLLIFSFSTHFVCFHLKERS